MEYLHSKNVIHRDLKTLNVLLDDNDTPIITDFGYSRTDSLVKSNGVGTPNYMSPEMIKEDEDYSFPTDVFSFSLLLWELYAEKVPYSHKSFIQHNCNNSSGNKHSNKSDSRYIEWVEDSILNDAPLEYINDFVDINNITELKKPTNDLIHLIYNCKSMDPNERPTFTQIIDEMIHKKIHFYDEGKYNSYDMEKINTFYKNKEEERNNQKNKTNEQNSELRSESSEDK